MKRSFFQAAVISMVLNGCTTWTLTKRMEKNLDSNNTRMLQAIFNKSWSQHPTNPQLYGHELDMQDIAGEAEELEPTYSSSVRIRDVALRSCQKRWTIGRSGERGSGISVLAARHDDDDDDDYLIRLFTYSCMVSNNK